MTKLTLRYRKGYFIVSGPGGWDSEVVVKDLQTGELTWWQPETDGKLFLAHFRSPRNRGPVGGDCRLRSSRRSWSHPRQPTGEDGGPTC